MKRMIFCICLFVSGALQAQDIAFGRKMLDTLTAPYFWGRGYTNDGMSKAATFLEAQFRSYGLEPIKGKSFLQSFSYPVNTFPGDMALTINGEKLIPGKDFIVAAETKSIHASGKLSHKDSVTYINRNDMFIVRLEDKLTMEVASEVADYSAVVIDKKSLGSVPSSYEVNIDNKFIKDFVAANICGMVKGTEQPDSFIFITAHYDHLGGLGKETYFPGANDNASGVSLLLNLAHYYAQHPQRYSIGFILFAGEEAGLIGSKYYTENPLKPLKKIRFLINTDLAGTGEEGITVVNASEFPNEFAMMNEVNDKEKLLTKINPRGKAANSDHYFFTEKGVPSFFFYTLGGIKAYHDVFDKAQTLPLNEHEDLFRLLINFNRKLMGLN
ncbi:MAG: M28 family peptidase [Bacteroidetes bacterium]|nr:M28 family peptidase [Bacteroidota bacterium]